MSKLMNERDELELYFKNIASDDEKQKIYEKIDKYNTEIETIKNEISHIEEEKRYINLEFEKRSSEINDLFFKIFDLLQLNGD